MSKINRKGKQNRHEKVAELLLSGQPISVEVIKKHFKGTDQEHVLYRLPQNMSSIRLDGGVVKTIREGKKAVAYQLMNASHFNREGRYVGSKNYT